MVGAALLASTYLFEEPRRDVRPHVAPAARAEAALIWEVGPPIDPGLTEAVPEQADLSRQADGQRGPAADANADPGIWATPATFSETD